MFNSYPSPPSHWLCMMITLSLLAPHRYVIKAIIGEIERQLEAPEEESRGEGGEGGGRTVVEGEGEGGGEEERMDEEKIV